MNTQNEHNLQHPQGGNTTAKTVSEFELCHVGRMKHTLNITDAKQTLSCGNQALILKRYGMRSS
jgi:hypothetical protein